MVDIWASGQKTVRAGHSGCVWMERDGTWEQPADQCLSVCPLVSRGGGRTDVMTVTRHGAELASGDTGDQGTTVATAVCDIQR